jgi:cytochrome c peroxidase
MGTILGLKRIGVTIANLAAVAAIASAVGTAHGEPLRVPRGLDAGALVIPADNPITPEKVELGKQIFFDPRWSRSKTVSCASCHLPEHGWADPRRFSVRADGKPTPRHSPTVINRAFSTAQQWTGARTSLEDQAFKSSDSDPETVVRHLGAIPGYRTQFEKVFGTPVTAENVAKAIAAFERTIVSGNAPYDRFIAGDRSVMSPAAVRGFAVFTGKGRCVVCHSGPNFTDERYHNLGVGMDAPAPDQGRHAITKTDADRGAFKTPTLRDAARRPPYMHDGSLTTLAAVVEFYDRGGIANPSRSPHVTPLGLSAGERSDLVAFLEALSGEIDAATLRRPTLPPDP